VLSFSFFSSAKNEKALVVCNKFTDTFNTKHYFSYWQVTGVSNPDPHSLHKEENQSKWDKNVPLYLKIASF
jgi:hypothetical protein